MGKVIPYFIIVILGLIIYIQYQQEPETVIDVVTETVVRTVTEIDTVYITKTEFIEIEIPVPVEENGLKKYTTTVGDSLFTGTIVSWVDGILDSQTFDYTFNIPQITQVDTVFTERITTVTRTNTVYPSNFYIGLETGLEDFISPKAMFVSRHWAVGYRYGVQTNSHNLSFLIKF